MSLSGFGTRVMLASFGSIPSTSILWKSLKSIGVSSLNVWKNSPVKTSAAGLFFVGRFLITESIS